MNWYYALNGTQQGPVSEQDIVRLVASGTINAGTLIWRDGLPDWQPVSTALPAALGTAAPASAPQIGGVAVPEAQKDLYVQQLREGVAVVTPGTMRYAGFWIRAAAWIIDYLILMVPQFILQMGLGITGAMIKPPKPGEAPEIDPAMMGALIGVWLFSIALQISYKVILTSKYGATWGKMAVGLRIVNEDGSAISTAKAFGRFFAEWLSGLTCLIGYIIAAFDDQKRSLHDHVCTTRVIYR